MQLFFTASELKSAQHYQQVLCERGVDIELCEVEQLNARFFRQHPDLALCVDEHSLWLCANGMKMQPDWKAEISRLKRASIKSEMIARACQLSEAPQLIDATAGLGHDSLLMAHLGAQVTLLERHPILFTLLEDAQQQARSDMFLAKVVDRIVLVFADSAHYLQSCIEHDQQVDVIYLDPMFPQRDQHQHTVKKQAQVKKQMQLLHLLLPEQGEMDLGDSLLPLAQQVAKRVIVKRPRHAIFLNAQTPDHQWLGDACRFDAYFQLAL
ncbi:class I SAM-dependent methyltransferase [Acinetobacter sp. S40]|uniref:class I SAM-dependent methyltransferase n=1 Tax=unclassified Acinetobacter TaxID=196816 RepID=UPI00190B5198|nr:MULTISPECIES: class I SAM-dependent methyltransferase [unclassified Acinetobacter]MBJ9985938.1 class I SAM-dependent methyltransferase [Acinetobacter sp. S40]MBK0064441.1 class I SAM-dependent methyltransferase [Acinetobacter sp. S55]MBK0067139.1 class I SAM-dependent methyltransferase [Acinetobacter sp. S54]